VPHVSFSSDSTRPIQVIREHVCDFAARKLQASTRDYLRHRRWKNIWRVFKEDVELAAAITMQAAYRMLRAKQNAMFLRELIANQARVRAARIVRRFLDRVRARRQSLIALQHLRALEEAAARRAKAVDLLFGSLSRIICRTFLRRWREIERSATAHDERRKAVSSITSAA
jgi:hypothetical protein